MKKILLTYLFIFFVHQLANAQFTVTDSDGNTLADGSTIVTNATDRRSASWDFLIVNGTSSDIYIKAELISTTGDPSQFEFCFGLCYSGISLNQELPVQNPVTIPANGDSGRGNHMYNMGSNGSDIWDFEMQFFQTDATGTTRIGNTYNIIYRYDVNSTASINDNTMDSFHIRNTVAEDGIIVLSAASPQNLTIYNLLGKKVYTSKIEAGDYNLNLGHLSSQVYILQAKGDDGIVNNYKIVLR